MNVASAWLRGITVVAIADTYQPDAIYTDLVNGKIMPDESKIYRSIQMPDMCDVQYKNGMHITVNPQRVDIGKAYNESFKECLNDEVFVSAAKFVKTYDNISYRAIGLNCAISLPHTDPLRWMTQKFLKAKSPPTNISMAPQFTIKTDRDMLTLAFRPGEESRNGHLKRFVGVDCNRHYGGPFNTNADILHIVKSWCDTRDTILTKLGEVLELE